jgi:myosin-crossreactive antigen
MTLPLKIVKFFPLFRKPCHRDKRSKAALVWVSIFMGQKWAILFYFTCYINKLVAIMIFKEGNIITLKFQINMNKYRSLVICDNCSLKAIGCKFIGWRGLLKKK